MQVSCYPIGLALMCLCLLKFAESEQHNKKTDEEACETNSTSSEDLGESRSGLAQANTDPKLPEWIILLLSPKKSQSYGHLSGIGVRLSDNLFIADFQVVLRTEQAPYNCRDGFLNVLGKMPDKDLRTYETEVTPPEGVREFQSRELYYLNNPRLRLFRLMDFGHQEYGLFDDFINLELMDHFLPYKRSIMPPKKNARPNRSHNSAQLPSKVIFRLSQPTPLQTDHSVHDNCHLHVYFQIAGSQPTKFKYEMIAIKYAGKGAGVHSHHHEFFYDGTGTKKFQLNNNGAPIFCGNPEKLSFIAMVCEENCPPGKIHAYSLAEQEPLIKQYIEKFVSHLALKPLPNSPH